MTGREVVNAVVEWAKAHPGPTHLFYAYAAGAATVLAIWWHA